MRWMVAKARGDAFFLGKVLSEYQEANSLDDAGLAAALQCSLQALSRLILCRCPDEHDASFAQEVQTIAAYGPCSPDALMLIVREVSAMRALREQGTGSVGGLLMAARDRHEDSQEEKPPGSPVRKRRGSRNDE